MTARDPNPDKALSHSCTESQVATGLERQNVLPSDIAGIQSALPSGGTSAPADVVPENWSWLGGDGGEKLCGTVWHAPILYSIFLRAADEASLACVADERRQKHALQWLDACL